MKMLSKENLSSFLESLSPDFEVIAPLREGEDILFGNFDASRLAVDFIGVPRVSPKEYLFPQREKLFTFRQNGNVSIEAHLNEQKRIIWGIKPCDLYGVKMLDLVFLSDYVDTYYQARRENTLLLCLNCNQPGESCFCSSLGTGPFASDSYDLLFTDLGNNFLIEVGSKGGEALMKKNAELLTDAADKDKEKTKLLEEESKRGFKRSVNLEQVKSNLLVAFDDPLWAEESDKCFLCGGCNFVCPTCYCFNIEDIKVDEETTKRVRYWDSCQLGGFTQMAAENTRRTQAERLRQRIYHKFSYIPSRYEGRIGCTGCGRCSEVCLGGVDITNVLGRLS
jgi:ferredoxin